MSEELQPSEEQAVDTAPVVEQAPAPVVEEKPVAKKAQVEETVVEETVEFASVAETGTKAGRGDIYSSLSPETGLKVKL